MRPTRRSVTFSHAERKRLAEACQILGCSFQEFVHVATIHAVDEFEGRVSTLAAFQRVTTPKADQHGVGDDLGANGDEIDRHTDADPSGVAF